MKVDPGFWRNFCQETWRQGPARWPDAGALAEPGECYRWCCAAADQVRSGLVGARFRFYSEGRLLEPTPELYPLPSDQNFAGWIGRLEQQYRDVGVVINDFQVVAPELWRRSLLFLGGFYDASGLPPGGASLDLFCGRYRRGFFGLHKDEQDVFTTVVEGDKHFQLWPFTAFADHPEAAGSSPLTTALLPPIENEATVEPTLLNGSAGTMFYWPAEWWHLPVAGSGAVTTTLGLGVFRGLDPTRLLMDAAKSAIAQGLPLPTLPPAPRSGAARPEAEAVVDALLSWLAQPEIRQQAVEQLLSWGTGFGFAVLPEPLAECTVGAWFTPNAPAQLAWMVEGPKLRCWIGGDCLNLPFHPSVVRLLERVNEGKPLRIADCYADGLQPALVDALIGILLRRHVGV